jgi:hypothetical protein
MWCKDVALRFGLKICLEDVAKRHGLKIGLKMRPEVVAIR